MHYTRLYKKNVDVFKILLGENGDHRFLTKIIEKSSEVYTAMLAQQNTRYSKNEIDLMLEYIVGGKWRVIIKWLDNIDEISIDEMARIICSIQKKGLEILGL